MSEDLKTKVIDTIDSLIPKGQNSLDLRTTDMVYGITRAKEAVLKLFAESSTQTNDSNALNALDTISRQTAIDEVCKMMYECFGADEEELDAIEVTLHDLPSAEPRWVPVTERNPKGLGEYLVTWETWAVKKARYITIAWYMPDRLGSPTGEWLLPEPFRSGYPDPTVVAWMPCPNAWRVGAE